jgi:FkbM family methyltransferase
MNRSRIGAYLRKMRFLPLDNTSAAAPDSNGSCESKPAKNDSASSVDTYPKPDGRPAVVPLSPGLDLVRARVGDLITLRDDCGVSETIRTTGVWARQDVDLFNRLIKPGMFVADVGAYIGHHTVLFSRLVGANGLVVAFEPQRVPFRALNGNLLLNDCNNVEAFNCAIGANPALIELWPHKPRANFGAVPVVLHKGDGDPMVTYKGEVSYGRGGERADLSTMDLMLAHYRKSGRKVNFIKIDVQAFELFVIQGAKDILRIDRPLVFFEVSPYWMDLLMGYDYLKIYDLLESFDYLVVDPHGDHDKPTQRRWSGEQDEEWDCLAIPK